MTSKRSLVFSAAALFLIIMTACSSFTVAPVPGQAETAVVLTAQSQLTQISVHTLVAQLTQLAAVSPIAQAGTSTAESLTATYTTTPSPTLTATATPTFTATPTVPTATSVNTNTPSVTPIPCLAIRFITDVTVLDNSVFTPNQSFVKTWRLQNAGSCAWTPDFDIVFTGGSVMNAPGTQKINTTVNPGQNVDISLSMIAPPGEGTYQGDWKLRSSTGIVFGLGKNAATSFWVRIQVKNPVVYTSSPGVPLDFAANYCQASWSSTTGALSCPSPANDFTNGSVAYTTAPKLEGGYQDDEPTLILIPSNGSGGFISGKFPAITVQSGDRFQALIGCLDASPNCNVMFQLNYSVGGGAVQNIGSWTEVSDGNWTRIDIPVGSSLAGQSVQFILYGNNNNGTSQDDRLFLLVPKIKR